MAFFHRGRARHLGNPGDAMAMFMAWGLFQRIQNLPYKPPVTLALMGAMAFVHLFPRELPWHSVDAVAFMPHLILLGQTHRLWLSTLVHVSHTHLYYNLVSFLYKGVVLEQGLGSETFALVTGLCVVSSQLTFLAVSLVCARALGMPHAEYAQTVGFSGVIFALKVLINSSGIANQPGNAGLTQVLGLDLPWDRVVWVELIAAYVFSPGSSFLGHLSGILAGIALQQLFMPFVLGRTQRAAAVPARPRYETNRFHGGGRAGEAPAVVVVPPADAAPPGPARRPAPSPPSREDSSPGTAARTAPSAPPRRRAPPPPPPSPPEPGPGEAEHDPPPPALSLEELRSRRLERFR
jgi:membrane associated rhomboid family serine protease